jgi:hypothetical protein
MLLVSSRRIEFVRNSARATSEGRDLARSKGGLVVWLLGGSLMMYVSATSADGSQLQTLLREAIRDGDVRSFQVAQVKGGLRVKHKKHPGVIIFEKQHDGSLWAKVSCKDKDQEWKLLEAFVGRLVYHFRDQIGEIILRLNSGR